MVDERKGEKLSTEFWQLFVEAKMFEKEEFEFTSEMLLQLPASLTQLTALTRLSIRTRNLGINYISGN
jgi:hypothetical protein